MTSNFEIDLFIDDSYSPSMYWVQSSATFVAPNIIYKENGYGTVPSAADENGVFHQYINVDFAVSPESPENPVDHLVDLGAIPFDSENGVLKLHLIDGNSQEVASGIVKSEDAQHETRPWNAPSFP